MRYEELERKDWKPVTYMTFDPDTNEFGGYMVGYEVTKKIPENMLDVMTLCNERGITFKNIRFWDKDTELIPCKEKATGIEGYYNPISKEFKSLDEMLKSIDKMDSFEIL